jgi:hypothetical protein
LSEENTSFAKNTPVARGPGTPFLPQAPWKTAYGHFERKNYIIIKFCYRAEAAQVAALLLLGE